MNASEKFLNYIVKKNFPHIHFSHPYSHLRSSYYTSGFLATTNLIPV